MGEGLDAFRRGDGQTAYTKLKGAVDAGSTHPDAHMGLAIVARMLKRYETARDASAHVVRLDPENCEALIIHADALAGLGQNHAANQAYMRALQAAPPGGQASPHLARELERVEKETATAARRYEDHLRARAEEAGLKDPGGQSRIGQALDIMFGRKQVYHQKPLRFYLPELPQIQFYDKAVFEWAAEIEAAAPAIQVEAAAVYESGDGIEPYVPKTVRPGTTDHAGMAGNENWGAYHFFRQGKTYPEHLERCPATAAALSKVPQPSLPGNSPTALYSVLKPGASIPPHMGMMNVRLIAHLGLRIPDQCGLRVGNQTRAWDEGSLLIFDDSIEHEAWNRSNETRVVLLFDLWRPELTEEERHFAKAIYAGIASFPS